MMLLCVEKLVDEKYSRKEISGATHIVNVLTPLLLSYIYIHIYIHIYIYTYIYIYIDIDIDI